MNSFITEMNIAIGGELHEFVLPVSFDIKMPNGMLKIKFYIFYVEYEDNLEDKTIRELKSIKMEFGGQVSRHFDYIEDIREALANKYLNNKYFLNVKKIHPAKQISDQLQTTLRKEKITNSAIYKW